MFDLKGSFGERVVGTVGGRAEIGDIDQLIGKLSEIDARNGTVSQIFDASRVAGEAHLAHAARLALTSHAAEKPLASSLNMEFTCWVAGMHQIGRALERVGIRGDTRAVAILTVGATKEEVERAQAETLKELGIERDDGVLEVGSEKDPDLIEAFSISERELEVADVQKLILERVALLEVQR